METGLKVMNLWLCLSLVVVLSCAQAPGPWDPSMGMRPGTCWSYECPDYKLVDGGYVYEIRGYNSAAWISTGPIPSPSITEATRTGFLRLFSYIQGNNTRKEKLNMTAPVITQVTPGKSVYTVSFYLPKKNQQNPPEADGLQVQRWKPTYVAVRQVGGYVTDVIAKNEAAALMRDLNGTKWFDAILKKSTGKSPPYLVADYNPPSSTRDRVSEIFFLFDM